MSATYTKLRSGEWGIRVTGAVKTGDRVTVTRKNGEVSTETVGKIVWSGQGVSLCSIARRESAKGSRSRTAVERKFIDRHGWDGVRGSSSYYTSGMYDEES